MLVRSPHPDFCGLIATTTELCQKKHKSIIPVMVAWNGKQRGGRFLPMGSPPVGIEHALVMFARSRRINFVASHNEDLAALCGNRINGKLPLGEKISNCVCRFEAFT